MPILRCIICQSHVPAYLNLFPFLNRYSIVQKQYWSSSNVIHIWHVFVHWLQIEQ